MEEWLEIDIERVREDYLKGYYDAKGAHIALMELGLTDLEARDRLKF